MLGTIEGLTIMVAYGVTGITVFGGFGWYFYLLEKRIENDPVTITKNRRRELERDLSGAMRRYEEMVRGAAYEKDRYAFMVENERMGVATFPPHERELSRKTVADFERRAAEANNQVIQIQNELIEISARIPTED